MPPCTTKILDGVLDDAKLTKIETFVKTRAAVLAKEKHEEMEELLNDIIYQQMKKIRAQSAFIKHFEGVYELQDAEIATMKEECLAERIAITKIKASAVAASEAPKVFEDNEFACSHVYETLNGPQ